MARIAPGLDGAGLGTSTALATLARVTALPTLAPFAALASVAPLATLLLLAPPARAAELTATPATYRAAVAALQAGDTLTLAAGTYDGLTLHDLLGQPARPIVIRGPDSGPRALIAGRACCATVSIADSAHLVLRHLDLDQRGQPVDAVRAEADATAVHHVTLEDLRMYGFANDADVAGVRTACPAWDWVVRRVRVEDAGVGLHFGRSDGAAPFVRGLVEQSLVVDPMGHALLFEAQGVRPGVAGLPVEDTVTVVRDTVLIKATRATTGAGARATVRIGRLPPSGAGQGDRFELLGNFLFENSAIEEGLIRAEAALVLHDNLLVNSWGGGVIAGSAGAAYHNTIYSAGRALALEGTAAPVVGNAVFSASPTPLTGGAQSENVTETLGRAADFVVSPVIRLGILDLYPRAGRLQGPALDLTPFAAHLDSDRDFDGTPKTRTFRGAYSGAGTNPGWALAEAIKTVAARPPPDAGVAAADATTPGSDAGATPPGDAGDTARDAAELADAASAADARSDASAAVTPRRASGCSAAGPGSDALPLAALLLAGLVRALRRRSGPGPRAAAPPLDP